MLPGFRHRSTRCNGACSGSARWRHQSCPSARPKTATRSNRLSKKPGKPRPVQNGRPAAGEAHSRGRMPIRAKRTAVPGPSGAQRRRAAVIPASEQPRQRPSPGQASPQVTCCGPADLPAATGDSCARHGSAATADAISGRDGAWPAAAKLALTAYLRQQLTLPGAIRAVSRHHQHAQVRCPRVLPVGPPPVLREDDRAPCRRSTVFMIYPGGLAHGGMQCTSDCWSPWIIRRSLTV